MVNINSAYGGWLKAEDFAGPTNVIISRVEIRTFEDGKSKGAVFFNEFPKGVLLNVTNKNAMVSMFGTETDLWKGQMVCIYPTTTEFGADIVPCIRICPPTQIPPVQPQAQPVMQPQPAPVQNHFQPQPTPVAPVQQPQQDFSETNPPPHPGTNPLASG